jgi:hypothetical protein
MGQNTLGQQEGPELTRLWPFDFCGCTPGRRRVGLHAAQVGVFVGVDTHIFVLVVEGRDTLQIEYSICSNWARSSFSGGIDGRAALAYMASNSCNNYVSTSSTPRIATYWTNISASTKTRLTRDGVQDYEYGQLLRNCGLGAFA